MIRFLFVVVCGVLGFCWGWWCGGWVRQQLGVVDSSI